MGIGPGEGEGRVGEGRTLAKGEGRLNYLGRSGVVQGCRVKVFDRGRARIGPFFLGVCVLDIVVSRLAVLSSNRMYQKLFSKLHDIDCQNEGAALGILNSWAVLL